ncbi:superinfection immunity protein [Paraburkholderia sp. UCT31]|uniref:superinfection immunity protein n=1 Tax=Paraburkholderia sp. UCT31 TaxID=2615209 RepID=UPI00165588F2|nr:superinfection immunity protein [Paraburkholderia sp. UCT31]MBC8737085.1 superinfection immunity protein [Paraburkholderia sp. UCT31]
MGALVIMMLVLLGLVLYWIPTAIAFKRDHRNKVAILALNFFLGWVVIGWVGALVWALKNE